MTVAAYTLAVVLDLFVVFIGARFLLQPLPSAAGYESPPRRTGTARTSRSRGSGTSPSACSAWRFSRSSVRGPRRGSCCSWRWRRSATRS